MSRSKRWILASFVSLSLLAACGGGSPSPTPTPTPVPCPGSGLIQPETSFPDFSELFDPATEALAWTYPDPACSPESYEVEIATDFDFTSIVLTGGPGAAVESWVPGDPLDPATGYYWRVAAVSEGTQGPFSYKDKFYTGPACSPGSLAAPTLDLPLNGGEWEIGYSSLEWSYPDPSCVPESYGVALSTDYDFADTSRFGATGNPDTRWGPGSPLDPATMYYWKIRASSGGTIGPYSERWWFTTGPTCDAGALVAPSPLSPAPYEIVGMAITESVGPPQLLHWGYPDACLPEGFVIHLSTVYDFSDTSLFGATGTPAMNWNPGTTLEPATQYHWKVAGGVGTTVGPFSSRQSFFTGPECTYIADVAAPELLSPDDGAVIDTLVATLRYRPGDPACIPDGYFIDLQTDPTFSGSTLLAHYDLPGTTVLTEELDDCTLYYWRVAGIQDSMDGPFSSSRSFFVNTTGACAMPAPRAFALENVFCRFGPHKDFKEIGILMQGESAEVLGRNAAETWLVVQLEDHISSCWLSRAYVEVFGDLSETRIFIEPTLEPEPPECSKDLNKKACEAAGGTWVESIKIPSYCSCP